MIFITKCQILKVILVILVVVIITMATIIRTYDSTVLKQIQDKSKLKENHCFLSLEPKTRVRSYLLALRLNQDYTEDWEEENAYSVGYILLSTIETTMYKHQEVALWKAILHYPTKNASQKINHPFTVQWLTAYQLSTRLEPFKWKLPHTTLTYVLLLRHAIKKKTIQQY